MLPLPQEGQSVAYNFQKNQKSADRTTIQSSVSGRRKPLRSRDLCRSGLRTKEEKIKYTACVKICFLCLVFSSLTLVTPKAKTLITGKGFRPPPLWSLNSKQTAFSKNRRTSTHLKKIQQTRVKNRDSAEAGRTGALIRFQEKRKTAAAQGVILKFHQFPTGKQTKLIYQELLKEGLKKDQTIKPFKIWIFKWPEGPKTLQSATAVCRNLPNIPQLEYCVANRLYQSDSFHSLKQKPLEGVYLARSGGLFLEGVEPEAGDNASPEDSKATLWNSHKDTDNENALNHFHRPPFPIKETEGNSPATASAVFLLADIGVEYSETEAGFSADCPRCKLKPIPQSVPLNLKTCNLVSFELNLKEGQLSDYWAQELTGSDLLREELEKKPVPDKNLVAVFDLNITWENYPHGDMVKNLISGEGPQAVLPKTGDDVVRFFDQRMDTRLLEDALKLRKNPPSFINHSRSWTRVDKDGVEEKTPEDRLEYDAFKALSPPAVVVVAAGNYFPEKIEKIQSQASKDFDMILVGNFSSKGFVEMSSQAGKEVHILAPVDDKLLTTVDSNGKYRAFGGSSGSAPQVTGALAGFEWLSSYHPSPKESKRLLEKTSTPTFHSFEKPRRNGVGLLNAYKLGMVGRRLKKICKGRGASCFQKEINSEEIYNFKEDRTLKRDLGRVFPECSSETGRGGSCQEKGKFFKRLRKAVLLNPKQEDLWEALNCIYENAGFSANGEMLHKTALSAGSRDSAIQNLLNLAKGNEVSAELLRAVAGVAGKANAAALFFKKANVKNKGEYASLAAEWGGKEGEDMFRHLAEEDNIYVKLKTAQALSTAIEMQTIEMDHKDLREILKRLLEPEKVSESTTTFIPDTAGYVAQAAGRIGGEEGKEVLQIILQRHGTLENKKAVARAAGHLKEKGVDILRRLFEDMKKPIEDGDEDIPVLIEVKRSLLKINSPEADQALKGIPLIYIETKDILDGTIIKETL